MVADNLHLHFLPRSLQLNMSKNNNNNAGKPQADSKKRPADDNQKKKRKMEEENKNYPAMKEGSVLLDKKKLKTKKKNKDDAFSANVSSELEELVAGFLSSRRLSNTLSTFLSETRREYAGKAHKVRLEDIYHSYCNQIHESPRKKNAVRVEVNSLGNADFDLKLNEENKKNQDEERKYGKKIDAHMANLLIKTSNGSSIEKTCTSERDPYRSDRRKDSGIEAVDDFSAHTKRERTEKAKRNSEILIGIHKDKSSAKLSNTSNEVEQVLDHPEPVCESQNPKGEEKKKKKKKKEVASHEKNWTDNDKQIGGKKSKKMTTQVETKAQPMESLTLYEAAAKTKNADLVQDFENRSNIELPKKEKRKKQRKLDELSSRDNEEHHNTRTTMACGTPFATALNTFKKESNIESVEDLSVDPRKPRKFEQSNQERKKSLQMNSEEKTEQNSNKKNKKEKKALKKIQAAFSCDTRGGVKGTRENLSEETGNTRDISQADEIFDTNRYSIGESEALEKGSAGTLSQNSTLGNQDDSKEKDQHVSPKLMKDKQERSDKVNFVGPRLGDNSYWAKDGADNGYGAKAQEVFEQVNRKGLWA